MAPWEHGKGRTELLQRFRLQLVKQQYLGVKVAQLAREELLPLQGAEEIPPNHKAGEKDMGLGVLPQAQPVNGFLTLPALPSGGAHEPSTGTPRPYPGPFAKRKRNSFRLPAVKPSALTSRG